MSSNTSVVGEELLELGIGELVVRTEANLTRKSTMRRTKPRARARVMPDGNESGHGDSIARDLDLQAGFDQRKEL